MKGKTEKRKFNQSVELAVKLRELDLKRPEQRINESLELPTAASKTVKVAVIAGGDLAVRAKNAGADIVIGREDLDKMARDKKAARKIAQNYDFFVAEAPLMPQVGKSLGQMLGPRGKMPTPIPPTAPIDDVLKRQRKNVRLKMKDQPVIQTKVGSEEHQVRRGQDHYGTAGKGRNHTGLILSVDSKNSSVEERVARRAAGSALKISSNRSSRPYKGSILPDSRAAEAVARPGHDDRGQEQSPTQIS